MLWNNILKNFWKFLSSVWMVLTRVLRDILLPHFSFNIYLRPCFTSSSLVLIRDFFLLWEPFAIWWSYEWEVILFSKPASPELKFVALLFIIGRSFLRNFLLFVVFIRSQSLGCILSIACLGWKVQETFTYIPGTSKLSYMASINTYNKLDHPYSIAASDWADFVYSDWLWEQLF